MKKAARVIGSLAFAFAIAAGSEAARAQSPAEDVAADGAAVGAHESLVESGIELRRNGRDEEALAVFSQALKQAPDSTRIKVHLAATYQALGQWVEAERYLREAASNPDDAYIRRHRTTIEKAYAFIEQRLGRLDVVGGPDGAELVLSGQTVGALPLTQPLRVPVGSYLLEVRKPGYYTVSRPISIGSGAMLRESVVLGAREQPELGASAAVERGPIEEDTRSGSPRWLTWTLGGAGVGALAISAVAFGVREKHAARWNSDDCTAPGLTRGDVCQGELDSGRSAERIGVGAAIASGVFFGGALASYLLERREPTSETVRVDGCSLGLGAARCFGSF
jgi:hypothetical protein